LAWDDGLSEEQRIAASHVGAHARLLAGPGTGKTHVLTRHISFLVETNQAAANGILALTFTRAAAHELRMRVSSGLGEEAGVRVSTLHAFALRQLLRNSSRIPDIPSPLRIADDWEERYIVLEDIKQDLSLRDIDDVKELFAQLQAD
jgi:DNA helicase-2/ATP-dependent DNA helicase PcrA